MGIEFCSNDVESSSSCMGSVDVGAACVDALRRNRVHWGHSEGRSIARHVRARRIDREGDAIVNFLAKV